MEPAVTSEERPYCKGLSRYEYQRQYRAENAERLKLKKREYYEKNKTEILAKQKEYAAKAPDFKTRTYRNSIRSRFGEAAEGVRPRPELCEVCDRPNQQKGRGLHFDHCHTTGKFRGWLCAHCNTALGQCEDNPDILRRLIAYLEK